MHLFKAKTIFGGDNAKLKLSVETLILESCRLLVSDGALILVPHSSACGMLVVKLWAFPWHCIQVKLECAGGGRETQQTGLSRAAAAASLKVSLLGIEKVKIHHHFSWKEIFVSCGIKKKIFVLLGFCPKPMNQNKLKRATFCQFDLLSCKYSKWEWSTFWSLRLSEKSRHQAGLRCFATDRDKPRDFISFLPEPAKLVSPFALGQEGLCGAARWPPETTILQMIQQNSRLKSKKNVVKVTLLTWRAEEMKPMWLMNLFCFYVGLWLTKFMTNFYVGTFFLIKYTSKAKIEDVFFFLLFC